MKRHDKMKIKKFEGNKKDYIDLLLLADEEEAMVDKYINKGDMFILDDGGVKAECIVTAEAEGVYEIKNIAVSPEFQKMGYGRKLIEFVLSYYMDWNQFLVGTGESPKTLDFYRRCGFRDAYRIENFFTDNYEKPIYEDGKQLVDMIYLKIER